ncbi:Xaa-Pro dipeptidase [Salinicola aestuarinus]|uniref:Xaa-Pro dipeptidase n=1 Tax=Salinicola aestuarinus TaxID=1949082 RepID=UPI000DA12059|nr:Xaa-Pro dipeptidase [Salinicola aestuarinus]
MTLFSEASASRQRAHLARLQDAYTHLLDEHGFDAVAIYSGHARNQYADDQQASFAGYGHFIHWTGTATHQHDWLLIRPGHSPHWCYFAPADFWHLSTPAPVGVFADFMTLTPHETTGSLPAPVASNGRLAVIGDVASLALPEGATANPEALCHALDELRLFKDAHERYCLFVANQIALEGHRAARTSFAAGGAELDAQLAYLAATRQRESELPYQNIVGINSHAGTLHYQHYDKYAPDKPRSLLVDAGHRYLGYCADITRTWSASETDPLFTYLTEGVTDFQRRLIARLAPGVDFVTLHDEMHQHLGELLVASGIVNTSVEAAIESGLTRAFCPHGLGHSLGVQVHDVAGRQRDASGAPLPPPARDPALRLTRTLETDMVVTIEPGLYVIPMLLEPFRHGSQSSTVDWTAVDRLADHGGIRIEDNVMITYNGHDNLTQGEA